MQQRAVSPSQSGNLTIKLFAVAGSSSCLLGSYEKPRSIFSLSTSLSDISYYRLPRFDVKVKATRNYFDGFVFNCANNYLMRKAQSSTDKLNDASDESLKKVITALRRGGSPSTPPMLMNAETELIDAKEAARKKVEVIMDKFVKLNDASDESLNEVITALREIACYYSSLSGPFWQYIADDIWAEVYAKNLGPETETLKMDASKYATLGGEQTKSIIRMVLASLSSSTYRIVLDTYRTFRDSDTLDHELNDANEAAAGFVDRIFDMFLVLAGDYKGEPFDLLKLFADGYSRDSLTCSPNDKRKKNKWRRSFKDRYPDAFLTFENAMTDAFLTFKNAMTKLNDAQEASNMEAKDIIDKFNGKLNNASDESLEEVITDFFCDVVLVKCSSWYECLISEILRLRYEMILHPLLTLKFKGTFIKKENSEIAEIISILPRCGQHDCGHLHSPNSQTRKFCISWKKPSRTGEVSGILSK